MASRLFGVIGSRPRANRKPARVMAARMLFPWMFAHRTLIADYWLKREQRARSSRPRFLIMIASAWVAHGLYPFVISHDPIQTVFNVFKVTIHEPHVSASNSCLEMQLRVIYRFWRSACCLRRTGRQGGGLRSDRQARNGYRPCQIQLGCAGGRQGPYDWLGPPPPSFASHSVRVVSIRNALSRCHE